MKQAVVYIHGKGGTAAEAERYRSFFPQYDVIGFDYKADTPWEAKKEFAEYFDTLRRKYGGIRIIANSIGAFFAMNAPENLTIKEAYFISPVVDMEKLITDMMTQVKVTEDELRQKERIETPFGETLSWEYFRFVRENPIKWKVPTHVLYGENDALTSFETISKFAEKTGAELTVMPGGEHWFHTDEQMKFLDDWITSR